MSKTKLKISIGKISLEGFSFEYEGDQENVPRLQNAFKDSIGKILSPLTEMQDQIIEVEAKSVPNESKQISEVPSNGSSKRRRKSKKVAEKSLDENGNPVKSARHIRPNGQSCLALTRSLIADDFFSTYRTTANVREELTKKGHHFESNHVSSVLLQLTKSKELARDKNADDVWVYQKNNK